MNKKNGTFDKKKISKNTVCRVPVRARYSLRKGSLEKLEAEYADVTLEQFGQLFARGLGIDI